MTWLIASVYGHSEPELRHAVADALEQGADAVELRLDLCDGVADEVVWRLRETGSFAKPVIVTIRSSTEGGAWDGADTDRVSRLIDLGPVADYLDVELELWNRSANIRQKIGLALSRAGHVSQSGGTEAIEQASRRRLILSNHDQVTRPNSLHSRFVSMVTAGECDIPKLAWRARTVRDNFEAFDLLRESPRPAIVICMGGEGIASRVLAKKFGAFGTFASLESGKTTATGQATLKDMLGLYRWDSIGPRTAVYGLIGNPVEHSLSPVVHNAAMRAAGVDGVYLPFRVEAGYESFKAFMVEALARPWLDLRGLSVTLPHKEHAFRFLKDAGGTMDSLSEQIGAVNTLVVEPGGRLSGLNTDQPALLGAARSLLGGDSGFLMQQPVAILGAGGVARAAVRAFLEAGADVVLFNRTDGRASELAAQMGCSWRPWSDRGNFRSRLLVNCTSCGMTPNEADSPLSAQELSAHGALLDTIYRPPRTKLVREAERMGIPACGGLELFISQAAMQFERWTGQAAPRKVMQQAAQDALSL